MNRAVSPLPSGPPSDISVLRILDASANRAAEGLRTLEEYARMVLEDRYLSESAKTLRHSLRVIVGRLPTRDLAAARSVGTDVGTEIMAADELRRPDIRSVVAAAAGRTQEALRCLEEYVKALSEIDEVELDSLATSLQSLRYACYSLAQLLVLVPSRAAALAQAKLYLLMPCDHDQERFSSSVESLYDAGVDLIQLRDKTADDRTIYQSSRIAASIARRLGRWFIVNDRADIAVASGASGVHIGQEELPLEAARRIVGPDRLVGVSTHSIDQARVAVHEGADYIGCGPTFPSHTKPFETFPGLEFLRTIAAELTLPAYAIGGINPTNIQSVAATGIHGVAVSAAILQAASPVEIVKAMRACLETTDSPVKNARLP